VLIVIVAAVTPFFLILKIKLLSADVTKLATTDEIDKLYGAYHLLDPSNTYKVPEVYILTKLGPELPVYPNVPTLPV